MDFSESQQKVIDYNEGNLLVIAGAGSGKTRVVTEKIIKTLPNLRKGEKILALTFSNKAADELRERLESKTEKDILNEKCFIGTIHNFCLELVNSKGYLIGLPSELHIFEAYDDRLKILYNAINNIPAIRNKYINDERKIKELFELLAKLKRELKFYDDYEESSNANLLFKEYDDLLLAQQAIDFDDILRYAYKILDTNEQVLKIYRRIYKYIFVDEAQDLNKAQYETIKKLVGSDNIITMVGDNNQSIYGFNGSSADYFDKYYRLDLNPKVLELKENYRSAKKIVEAAKKLENTFNIDGVCQFEGEFEINSFDNEYEEANWIVSKLKMLLNNGHKDVENEVVSLEQCAVIARNRYVFNELINILEKENIEYTLKVSINNSFTSESDIMKAFELGLKVIVNDKDTIHFNQLIDIFDIKENIKNLNELEAYSLRTSNSILISLFEIWKEIIPVYSSNFDFNKIIDKIDINNLDITDEDKNLALYDIDMFKKLWNIYVRKSNVSNRNLGNFLRSISLGETQIINESGLTLSTVHMSKGLEYDVVFIMGLNEGTFPDYRANTEEKILEEKHNMFVSITRAKRLCYLSYPINRDTKYGSKIQTKSRFILEIINK